MTIATPALERALKTSEVAEHLKCTQNTIYGLIREHRLRAVRVGSLWRVPESALAEFLEGDDRDAQ